MVHAATPTQSCCCHFPQARTGDLTPSPRPPCPCITSLHPCLVPVSPLFTPTLSLYHLSLPYHTHVYLHSLPPPPMSFLPSSASSCVPGCEWRFLSGNDCLRATQTWAFIIYCTINSRPHTTLPPRNLNRFVTPPDLHIIPCREGLSDDNLILTHFFSLSL